MEQNALTALESAALTLRAWPQPGSNEEQPLSTLISRINAQEGSFRSVTEDGLVGSVGDDGPQVELDDDSTPETEDEEPKSEREKVLAAREEIVKFANQALTESSHTLDFISLLLTSYNPKQASFTISPYIKQNLPDGCLGSEVVDPPRISETRARQNELTSFGWKLQSLSTAADSLLRAATNLEREMEKEAKYWEQVLSVKKKGWSVFRLPTEKRTLGVRYGSLESPPEFRDKGVAALRMGEDGEVNLDLGNNAVRGSLRVRVRSHGEFVASTRHVSQPDGSAEQAIMQARNDLFDGELYHEMHREARSLTSRGIKCVSEGICIPLKPHVDLVVDMLDPDQPQPDLPSSADSGLSSYPELAATAFRILLSYSHRQHHRRRTGPPPPMKQRKRARPFPTILQPLLLQLEHRETLMDIRSHLASLENTLAAADVSFKLQKVDGSLDLTRFTGPAPEAESPEFISDLMRALSSSLSATVVAKMEYNDTAINVSIRTHVNGTDYVVRYDTEGTDTVLSETPQEMHFNDLQSLVEHISHLVMLELVGVISKKHPKWEACAPDEGQLSTEPTMNGDVETLSVTLNTDLLQLAWSATNETEGEARTAQWPSSDEANKAKSFVEEAELLSNTRPAMSYFK